MNFITANLFLITEHLACKTLHQCLTSDPMTLQHESVQNKMSVTDVMKHVTGVLEGMEVIKSYGVSSTYGSIIHIIMIFIYLFKLLTLI